MELYVLLKEEPPSKEPVWQLLFKEKTFLINLLHIKCECQFIFFILKEKRDTQL